jgi:NAD(P)-dependent dehydrogenase (short-subunit alcohol dehydrogenase family)
MMQPSDRPHHILIVGASGGIGSALVEAACHRYPQAHITAWSRTRPAQLPDTVEWDAVDVALESSITAAAARLAHLDLAIVATGLLQRESSPEAIAVHPEKTWRSLDPAVMAESFAINTIAPAIIAKHVLPKLARDRRAVFAVLSARVGSIADNRLGGWYSYRAAKAALNQIIRTLSIELAAKAPHAICVGLHPGTVDTPLSKPFQAGVAPERLFTPQRAADQLLDVIASRVPHDTGHVFDWGGLQVPP